MKKALIVFIALSILTLGGCQYKPQTLQNESYIVMYQFENDMVVADKYGTPIIYNSYGEAVKHAPCPSYIFKLYSKVESNPVQKIVTTIEDGETQ